MNGTGTEPFHREAGAASEAFFRWAFLHTSGGTYSDRLPAKMREAMLAKGRANMTELKFGTGERLKGSEIRAIACPVTCLTGERSDRSLLRATRKIARLLPRAAVREIAGAATHCTSSGRRSLPPR